MGTVTISAVAYPVYGTLSGANTYLAARLSATAWTSATTDQKSQALVTATRLIKSYLDGRGHETNPETNTDAQLAEANYELALLLLANPALADSVMTAAAAKRRVKAGSAEVEFAVNVRTVTKAHGFPDAVFALIRAWMAAQAPVVAPMIYVSGTCERSTLIPNGSQLNGGD